MKQIDKIMYLAKIQYESANGKQETSTATPVVQTYKASSKIRTKRIKCMNKNLPRGEDGKISERYIGRIVEH